MNITFEVDNAAAAALGFVIRQLDVTDIRTLLRVPGDFGAGGEWERAVDALSPGMSPATRCYDPQIEFHSQMEYVRLGRKERGAWWQR